MIEMKKLDTHFTLETLFFLPPSSIVCDRACATIALLDCASDFLLGGGFNLREKQGEKSSLPPTYA